MLIPSVFRTNIAHSTLIMSLGYPKWNKLSHLALFYIHFSLAMTKTARQVVTLAEMVSEHAVVTYRAVVAPKQEYQERS